MRATHRLIDRLRAWPWLAGALIAALVVAWIAPHQIGVLIWSLSKLALSAWLGYWIDRSVFYYGRPGDFLPRADDAELGQWIVALGCMLRRALVMSATIIALGLGV